MKARFGRCVSLLSGDYRRLNSVGLKGNEIFDA